MCFVAMWSLGQPFSWTGVGVRWIKAGIFTIDVAQIWQDFQQSPTLRLLGIWHNLGNIKVSLSLHTSPKNCTIPSQIIAETFLWTRYKKKCCRITSHISGIQGTALPQSDEAKNGRLLLSLLATNTQLQLAKNVGRFQITNEIIFRRRKKSNAFY